MLTRRPPEALLPEDDLRHLAVTRLTGEEYPPADAQRLAAELVRAATQRLVRDPRLAGIHGRPRPRPRLGR
jgi:hypothetical protein